MPLYGPDTDTCKSCGKFARLSLYAGRYVCEECEDDERSDARLEAALDRQYEIELSLNDEDPDWYD